MVKLVSEVTFLLAVADSTRSCRVVFEGMTCVEGVKYLLDVLREPGLRYLVTLRDFHLH